MSEQNKKTITKSNKFIGPIIGVIGMVFLMLFQGGFFVSGQIIPGLQEEKPVTTGEVIEIKSTTQPDFYKAIGSVRSRNEVEIVPRIVARIIDIKVRSGDQVKRGDLLAVLDAKDLAAIVSQGQEQLNAARANVNAAKEQVNSAKAALDLATNEMNRTRALFEKNAAAKRDFDRAIAALKQAEAGMHQAVQGRLAATAQLAAAEQGIKQTEAGLSYATINAPIDGIVAERMADPGDLGNPASMIMRIFDPSSLMLEVAVRESLVSEVKIGALVKYEVPALKRSYEGTVKEIVPSVDPQTRTFLVKICIDKSEGLMPGMFGTITVPLKTERKVILVPEKAIIKTGQLESVVEILNGKLLRRQIRSIKVENDLREVVSGLSEGQKIKLNPND
jgi:RND family efflux transporter MFP subunit